MADKKKVEKKVDEKSEVKSVKKSSYSKKKKVKKNIVNGIAYVQSTFNNTIVSIADTQGNVVSWASAGQKGFKGSRKSGSSFEGSLISTRASTRLQLLWD